MMHEVSKKLLAMGPRLTLGERIGQLVDAAGGPTRAGALAGVSRQTVDNWRTGRTVMPMAEALTLAEHAGVSLDWVATGHDRRPDLVADGNGGERGAFAVIYRYEVGAQGELVEIEDREHAALAVREQTLKALGIAPKEAALLAARGDAMAPTINDGDLMLIDRHERRIGDGIFVIRKAGVLAVRRAQTLVDGAIMLLSDNDRYHPERVEAAQVAAVPVAGRVRMVLKYL